MKSVRRGFTLIELLAVMAVFSVTLTTIVLTLHGLQKAGDRARTNLSIGVQQGRFAHQLRTDAHLAQAFSTQPADKPDGPATVLLLTLPNQQIVEYHLRTDSVERLVRSGDTVQQRESYQVRPGPPQGWTIVTNDSQPLVTVHLQRQLAGVPTAHQSLLPWRVDAALGLLLPHDTRPTAERMP